MIQGTIPHKTFRFPVGELQVNLDLSLWADSIRRVNVVFTFEKNEDIFELLLYCDAAKRAHFVLGTLQMNYVPFSRQDRVNHPGESFSLKVFADLINGLNFKQVIVSDPHSDVTPALFNNVIVRPQWDLLSHLIMNHVPGGPFWLVAPDAGALKKTHTLAQWFRNSLNPKALCQGVIEASKLRSTTTGEITGTVVHASRLIGIGDLDVPITYVIPDDIIDGGRTFVELAKELRGMGAQRVHLYATFGFFTKGKQVFNGVIDEVHVVNDYTKRQL